MRIGFIGLGSQGAPMARRIVEAGYDTTLWARRSATLESFADTEATVADSPAELAAASDLVCLCVVDDDDVRQIVTGELGVLAGLAPGGVIAIHSTIAPDTCRELAGNAAAQGVTVIDAPVSGGGHAAAAGNLLVMVGGEVGTVERCRPVFSTYGDPVVHLGPLGSGQVTKLLNNVVFAANLGIVVDAFAMGGSLGLDPERLGEVIAKGSANSYALGAIAASGGTIDAIASLAGTLLQKDARLFAGLAGDAGAESTAVLAAADSTLEAMGHPR